MPTAILNGKGQVTIPVAVRTALRIGAGDRVEFIQIAPNRFELAAATHSVTALKGMIRKSVQPVTIEAMDEAIAQQNAKAASGHRSTIRKKKSERG